MGVYEYIRDFEICYLKFCITTYIINQENKYVPKHVQFLQVQFQYELAQTIRYYVNFDKIKSIQNL